MSDGRNHVVLPSGLSKVNSAIIIVLDNDTRDTDEFLGELNSITDENCITMDHVFCLAIEELEAWLLGDQDALFAAYPNAKGQVLLSYEQDSICGTWETLAEAIYPGGIKKMKKDCPTYREIGTLKSEWAENIGSYIDVTRNKSNSFNFFINEINKRIEATV